MLITAVEERRHGVSALIVDGEYAFCVDTVTLVSSGFGAGDTISDEQLLSLKEASDLHRAKEKALYLLEYRPRTEQELMEKLCPLFGEKTAAKTVERLRELRLVDDEAYARDHARTLLLTKHFSARRALFELMKKGIEKELAEEIIAEIEPDPAEQIRALLQSRYRRWQQDEKARQRAINGLKSMGFSWYDITDAMNGADYEEEGFEEDGC